MYQDESFGQANENLRLSVLTGMLDWSITEVLSSLHCSVILTIFIL